MNINTLEIRIVETISITDVFYCVKKSIEKIINFIKNVVENFVIKILFSGVHNYSNPPNKLIRMKLDESLKFSFAFVLYN